MTKTVDGYCCWCRQTTFFTLYQPQATEIRESLSKGAAANQITITLKCQRETFHYYKYHVIATGNEFQKVGQWPSLVMTLAGETQRYRSGLTDHDRKEYSSAVMLAAHGNHIAAFVHLRRIFENLIEKRFTDYKAIDGWPDDALKGKRMDEKIKFLSTHLPSFLVEHSQIYSILSVGIHSLTEEDCEIHFDVVRKGILMVLEEDKELRRVLEERSALSTAINEANSRIAQRSKGDGTS